MRDRRIVKRADHVDQGIGVLVRGHVDEHLRARGAARRGKIRKLDNRRHPFFGLYIAVRRSRRASGTFDMPIDASVLPGAARAVSFALVIS